jgi:hypothetical protein
MLDIPSIIPILQKRVNNKNGLSNDPNEYIDDVNEVLLYYINPELGASLEISGDNFSGTPDIDNLIYSLLILRTEIHIIDRRLENDIELAVTSNTPAGSVNLTNRPRFRMEMRRLKTEANYEALKNIYLFGPITNSSLSVDISTILEEIQ